MAHAAGILGWAIDQEPSKEELKDIEAQAKDFASAHKDVIDPLVDRIEKLQAEGVGDTIYMFAATLLSIGHRMINTQRAVEEAARSSKN